MDEDGERVEMRRDDMRLSRDTLVLGIRVALGPPATVGGLSSHNLVLNLKIQSLKSAQKKEKSPSSNGKEEGNQ